MNKLAEFDAAAHMDLLMAVMNATPKGTIVYAFMMRPANRFILEDKMLKGLLQRSTKVASEISEIKEMGVCLNGQIIFIGKAQDDLVIMSMPGETEKKKLRIADLINAVVGL